MKGQVERFKRILENNNYMVLATSSDNVPWSTPVFFVFDKDYNFYWYSRKQTRHSQNISRNSNISAVIFGVGNSDEGFGVYLEGKAREVEENELESALNLYAKRAAKSEEEKIQLTTKQDFLGDSDFRVYKITSSKIYVSNSSTMWQGKYIDSKSEINF